MTLKNGFASRVQFGASIPHRSAQSRCLRVIGLVVANLLLGIWAASAEPPQMVQSYPPAKAVVDGRDTEYSVRFDRPVDHERSRLFITAGTQVIREMQPRLDAAPEVLYGTAVRLPPGEYELHWEVIPLSGGAGTKGAVPFTVGR
jgi:methionine-rich copper-binding protein CopC